MALSVMPVYVWANQNVQTQKSRIKSDAFNALKHGNTAPPSSSSASSNSQDSGLSSSGPSSDSLTPAKRPPIYRKVSVEFSQTHPPSPVALKSPKHRVPQVQVRRTQKVVSHGHLTPSTSQSDSGKSPSLLRIRSILKDSYLPVTRSRSNVSHNTRLNAGQRRHSATLHDLDEPMSTIAVEETIANHSTFKSLIANNLEIIRNSMLSSNCTPPSFKGALDEILSRNEARLIQSLPRTSITLRQVESAYHQLEHLLRAWAHRAMSRLDPFLAAFPHDDLAVDYMYPDPSTDQPDVQMAVTLIAKGIQRDLQAFMDNVREHEHLKFTSPVLSSGSPNLSSDTQFECPRIQPRHLDFSAIRNQDKENLRPLLCESPASSASSSPLPQKPLKRGKNEDQLDYSRQRVDVAQSAVKCLGVLFHWPVYFKLLPSNLIRILLSQILEIPMMKACRQPKDKDIVGFAYWLIASQRLPHALVDEFKDPILTAVQSMLDPSPHLKHRLSDKARAPVLQSLSAFSTLAKLYPSIFNFAFCRAGAEQGEITYTVLELTLAAPHNLRTKALAALGSLIDGVRLHRHWRDPSPEGMDLLSQHAKAFSKFGLQFFTYNNNQWLSHLRMMLMQGAVKGEEPWVLNYIAILPALLGNKFPRLEEEGPVLYINMLELCLTSQSQDIASMAYLSWRHLIFAMLSSFKEPREGEEFIWALREKPAKLLFQIVAPREKNVKPIHFVPLGTGISHAAQAFTDLLYGFTVAIYNAGLGTAALASNFDHFYTQFVASSSFMLFDSPHASDHQHVCLALTAMLGPCKDEACRPNDISALLSKTLLSGKLAVQNAVEPIRQLCRAVERESIQASDIPAWPQTWLVANHHRFLILLLGQCSKASSQGDSQPSSCSLEFTMSQPSQPFLDLWKAFVRRLTGDGDMRAIGMSESNKQAFLDCLETQAASECGRISLVFWSETVLALLKAEGNESGACKDINALLNYTRAYAHLAQAVARIESHNHEQLRTQLPNLQATFSAFIVTSRSASIGMKLPPRFVSCLDIISQECMQDTVESPSKSGSQVLARICTVLANEPLLLKTLDNAVENIAKLPTQSRHQFVANFTATSAHRAWHASHFKIVTMLQNIEAFSDLCWEKFEEFNQCQLASSAYETAEPLVGLLLPAARQSRDRSGLEFQTALQRVADLVEPWFRIGDSRALERLVETYHILLCLHQEGLGHNRDLKLLTRWESFLIAPFHANSTPSLAALADLARFWKHNYSLCASRDVPLKLCAVLTTAEEILGLRLLPEEAQEENEDTCVCVLRQENALTASPVKVPVKSPKSAVAAPAATENNQSESQSQSQSPNSSKSQSPRRPPPDQLVVVASQTTTKTKRPRSSTISSPRSENALSSQQQRKKRRTTKEASQETQSQALRVLPQASEQSTKARTEKQTVDASPKDSSLRKRRRRSVKYIEISSDDSSDSEASDGDALPPKLYDAGLLDCVEIVLDIGEKTSSKKTTNSLKRTASEENSIQRGQKRQRLITQAINNHVVSLTPVHKSNLTRSDSLVIKPRPIVSTKRTAVR